MIYDTSQDMREIPADSRSFKGLDVPAQECPICTETFEGNPWTMATLPCCKQSVCWACLCRHAESVIDDARPDMNCPLFCGCDLLLVKFCMALHGG